MAIVDNQSISVGYILYLLVCQVFFMLGYVDARSTLTTTFSRKGGPISLEAQKDSIVFCYNNAYLYGMDKILRLKTYVDGGIGDTPFPNSEDQVEIGSFRYDAKRMGGAPTITATVMHSSCLDDEWTDKVYGEFNGEKFYLKQTPTSSYSSEDARYKHELELVSERVILDNVYLFDASMEEKEEAVSGNPQKSSEWQLLGTINNSRQYDKIMVRSHSGGVVNLFVFKYDTEIRIVSGPPIDIKIESATGNVYILERYGYFSSGISLSFSYYGVSESAALTNSSTFTFFGNIADFADKLNRSLEYSNLRDNYGSGWNVYVDSDVELKEEKLIQFDNTFFSNAIQESYNTFEVPYYFKGKEIHFGYTDNVIAREFHYGVDDALMSITKSNANYKIVNRATGTGSSENIPYYYPNTSPKGTITAKASSEDFTVTILDNEVFANAMQLDEELKKTNATYDSECDFYSGQSFSGSFGGGGKKHSFYFKLDIKEVGELSITLKSEVTKYVLNNNTIDDANFETKYKVRLSKKHDTKITGDTIYKSDLIDSIDSLLIPISEVSSGYTLSVDAYYNPTGKYQGKGGNITYNITYDLGSKTGWTYNGKAIELKDFGLKLDGEVAVGSTITQKLVNRVKTSNVLLPPKYRETLGEERFYNAVDGLYKDENNEDIKFNNPFVEGKPKEHIVAIDDIKPTIKDKKVNGLNIDMFSEFAYDEDDNDETYVDEEDGKTYYKHPYFFGKLRKLDFNLFNHAIEGQAMMIEMTSGDCGACKFEIGATEEFPKYNPVQVHEEDIWVQGQHLYYKGTPKRDGEGRVICGLNEEISEDDIQDIQQDTINNEVWIALKKEEDTYGMIMPNKTLKPKAEDTFIITGINLPQSYITDAEERLEQEIIKYLKDNNDEKFKFSIKFSRIFFEENPSVLALLDENAKMFVWYNGVKYTLFVTSLSYNMRSGEVLPEITVELDDTLVVSQNVLQQAISQVKSQVGRALNNIDFGTAGTAFFLRKDQDDEAQGKINFRKGVDFGKGGKVEILDDNSAKLTIEYLEVTKKATFTSLEIQEKTHIGGQMLITPASMNCGEVEEFEDYYRCYFQTQDEDGEQIFNQFVEGDQAICQTFNAWGSKYYWRLVVGIGNDYIDLSKTDCDEDSDAPSEGDKIIQLGNRTDKTRQAAQVLSSYGENSPSFIMYNGINSFSLIDKEVTGIEWNPKTQEPQLYSFGSFFFGSDKKNSDGNLIGDFITFQRADGDSERKLHVNADVTFGENSEGLSDLREWKDLKDSVDEDYARLEGILEGIQNQIDGVVENYFLEGAPSVFKAPVTEWTTEEELLNHIGDTYTNINSYTDDSGNIIDKDAGKSWRWCECTTTINPKESISKNIPSVGATPEWTYMGTIDTANNYKMVALSITGTFDSIAEFVYDTPIKGASGPPWYVKIQNNGDVYALDEHNYFSGRPLTVQFYTDTFMFTPLTKTRLHWHIIADTDATKALEMASKALETADGKRRVFTDIPRTPYDVGDLWVTSSKDLMICKTKKEIGDFDSSHWEKATKYTDDTKANEVLSKLNQSVDELNGAISDAEEAMKGYTDGAKAELGRTITDINNTKANIADVYTKAEADGKIDAKEQEILAQAEEVAKTQAELLDTQVKAYADGEISKAEAEAIAEAQKRVDAAKADLEKAIALNVKNIVPNSSTIRNYMLPAHTYPSGRSSMYYAKILLPIRVNAGETYTFKCENSSVLAGSQPSYRIRIDDGTKGEAGITNIFSNMPTVQFGKDQSITLTIVDGVTDKEAYLAILRTNQDSSYADSVVFNNVSLVRGTTPMSVWEDYKGDAALDNLLLTEEEFVSESTEYCYQYIDLPNNVNGGETYTVSIDNLQIEGGSTSDTQYQIEIASKDSNYTPKSNAITIDFKRKSWGTMTIWNSANDMPARLAIRKVNPNASTTARIKGIALVRGPLPLMEWKESRALFNKLSESIKDAQSAIDAANKQINALGISNGQITSELKDQKGKVEQAQKDLENVYTKAQADGKISDAEKRAIKDAEDKLKAATEVLEQMINDLATSIANDYGYLRDAFGQITQGDVFLSKLMGVGTRNGKDDFTVNAFMNGDAAISGDSSEGKLMLATGIPVTGGDLAQRAKTATTRIYEKGKIVTNNLVATNADITGKVTATSGSIGDISIDNGELIIDTTKQGKMHISEEGIRISEQVLENNTLSGIDIGGCGYTTLSATVGQDNVCIQPVDRRPAAIIANAYDDANCWAIYVAKGQIGGLRPSSRAANSGDTLLDCDHTIWFSGNGTLYLPTFPPRGQVYKIIHHSQGTLNITSNNGNINKLKGASGIESSLTLTSSGCQIIDLYWGGTNWHATNSIWE